ncbi:hypothetical protein A6B43_04040 [Vespertiliibacter pulmonis]|uniref:Tetratricopeptide repeat protein n=2 Tax=Vespertiliibacter pulmonis TaxID=1443036 RepID=A0A3N4VHV8_9PAST|nr:hypothetical protein A6B43_04040 [Vespertiliibacter pulmonis]RPE82636.1 hypothetical protein EDC46_1574 [Vespertiliibacter pulmonis]
MTASQLLNKGIKLLKQAEYDQAISKLTQALESITDTNTDIQLQLNIQHWLGRCYFEQAIKSPLNEAKPLFELAIEHYNNWLQLAESLTTENKAQEQINAQQALGYCYFKQAIKNPENEAKPLFQQAITHHEHQLKLAKELTTENNIQQQINAQYWLGRCYMEQAIKSSLNEAKPLFQQAIEHHKHQLELAKSLTTENNIQQQIYAQVWLGRCYLAQAIKSPLNEAKPLFQQAITHHEHQLELAKSLTTENNIQEQITAQTCLGHCYLSQTIKNPENEDNSLFNKAIEHYTNWLQLAEGLSAEKNAQAQINAQEFLDYCHFEFSNKSKKFDSYFKYKKEKISKQLSTHLQSNQLKKQIITILTVLSIEPVELKNIPLAHYTTPYVAELLFGLNKAENKQDSEKNKESSQEYILSPMRMNSATYMNDPSEGKSLLEFLDKPDISLENITQFPKRNAFFSCFSSRINDLNQFRLYGKENQIEASGCCLIFNKKRNWLKQPDIRQSFSFSERDTELQTESISDTISKNYPKLPLYQVAYLTYMDSYIDERKCTKFNNTNFAFCLHQVGNNSKWHKKREKELKKALNNLKEKIKSIDKFTPEQEADLEYIRYLFKDFAFRDEEEFRLLKMAEIGSDEIKICEKTQSIYVEYTDIRQMVDEVILGTNYERTDEKRKVEVFRHKMKQHLPEISVVHSSLPINFQ